MCSQGSIFKDVSSGITVWERLVTKRPGGGGRRFDAQFWGSRGKIQKGESSNTRLEDP